MILLEHFFSSDHLEMIANPDYDKNFIEEHEIKRSRKRNHFLKEMNFEWNKRGEIGEKGKVAKSMYFIQQVLIHVVKKKQN